MISLTSTVNEAVAEVVSAVDKAATISRGPTSKMDEAAASITTAADEAAYEDEVTAGIVAATDEAITRVTAVLNKATPEFWPPRAM